MGQGNCTLALHHNYDLKVPPLLIDAGSTAYKKFKPSGFRDTQINLISAAIVTYLTKIGKKEIYVVATHADVDHYKWLNRVIDACVKIDNEVYVSKIFLGSARALYTNAAFNTFLGNCDPEPIFVTLNNATTARTIIFDNGQICYSILPALQGTVEADKNKSSLVVLVQDGPLKMAIMGDAEKATTDHILHNDTLPVKVWILHGAHHGADTLGSNHLTWLEALQLEGAIFSSGVNTGLLHPNGAIVKRVLDQLVVEGPEYFPLYFGLDDAVLRCYAKGSLGYGLTTTRKFVRGTLTQGTIDYALNPATNTFTSTCKDSTHSALNKECVLKTLLKFPRGLLERDHLQEIDVSGMGIDDNIVVDRDDLLNLLTSLTNKAAQLEKLLMNNNSITGEPALAAIVKLIKNRLTLKMVNLCDNGISVDRHVGIKAQLDVALAAKLLL
jgi:beta-lactamase superfamily II metal-dependent hydrolase